MVNSLVSRKDLDTEMTVVRNEFESGENSPSGVLRERVAATAYLWHNYGRAIIGARSDIENVPIERLQAFYRNYYQPDNAVLIVAGKFDEAAALRAGAEALRRRSPKPARALRATYTVEPTQDGERTRDAAPRRATCSWSRALYHMPPGTHPDYAAVDVLVALLGHVPSGRLHKALVETGIASSVFGTEQPAARGRLRLLRRERARRTRRSTPARDALLDVLEGFAAQAGHRRGGRARAHAAAERHRADASPIRAASRSVLSETAAHRRLAPALPAPRPAEARSRAADVQRVALRYLKTVEPHAGPVHPDRARRTAPRSRAVPDVAALLQGLPRQPRSSPRARPSTRRRRTSRRASSAAPCPAA